MDTNWRSRMQAALAALAEIDLGYPQGEHDIAPPASPAELEALGRGAALPDGCALLGFYAQCASVTLPDVWNGYFLHPPQLVLRGIAQGEPIRLTAPLAREIMVFGSDGGGGRFAIGADGDGEILHLGDGAVEGGTFEGDPGNARMLAPDLPAFLERLLADVEAFVAGDESWRHMV